MANFIKIYQGSEDFHTFNRSGNVEELCLISRLREIAFNILPSDITFAVYYILWTSYHRSTYFPSIYGFNIMDNRLESEFESKWWDVSFLHDAMTKEEIPGSKP